LVEDMLPTLGATKLSSYEPGDEDKDLQTKFEALQDILWYFFAIELGIMPTIDRKTLVKPAGSHLDFIVVEGPKEQKEEGGQYAITEVRELQSEGSGRSTVHVEMSLPADVKYEAGDHLEITAWNHPHLVDQMCKSLGYDSNTWLKAVSKSNLPVPSWCPLGPVRLGQILSRELDINGVISRPVIQAITEALSDQHPYKAKLQRYGGKTQEALDAYEKEIVKNGINVVELLSQLPDVKIPLGVLLGVLPTLKKRSYSISSSPKRDSSKLTLSVGQVFFTTATGREHSGVASVYLGRLQVGSKIECHVVTSPMRYPADHMTPVICVCNGTGLAPFRGFLQEREHIQQQHGTIGQLHLFFGCRSRKEDFIYAEELFDHEARGLVKLHVAFSRDQEEKVYVQHKMRQEEELIADILMKQNGRFYVCGDARTMAKDVQEELRRMIAKFSGSTAEEAKTKFVEMWRLQARHRNSPDKRAFFVPAVGGAWVPTLTSSMPAEGPSAMWIRAERPSGAVKEPKPEPTATCPHRRNATLVVPLPKEETCPHPSGNNNATSNVPDPAPVIHTSLKKPPGPPYSLFVHNLPDLMPDFWVAARRLQKQYGPLVRLKFLGKKVYLLSDPELIAILMKERDKRLPKQELAAEGIFLADADIWAFGRRVLQTVFTGKAVSNFMPMFQRLGLEFIDEIEKEYNTNHVVKLIRLSERCMLDAICEVGLGIGDGHLDLKHEFNETFEWLSEEGIKRQTRLSLFNKLPTSANQKFFEMLQHMDHILDIIINRPLTDDRNDILALMLRASDPESGRKFTEREVKDQLITILVAGHKTSALLQSWAIFEISQDPHVEKRVKQEIKEVLGLDGTSLKIPELHELKELKYMDLVLKETLRMHPPAQSAVRGLYEKTPVNEWILDPCNIFISIYDTHRNSKYWPDPDRFDPDRFLPENVAKHHPAQYIPFGGYHRTCLGNVFALTEVKINLCLLYQLYEPRVSALHPIIEGNDLLFPPTDLPMNFMKRKKMLGHVKRDGGESVILSPPPVIKKKEEPAKTGPNKLRTASQASRLIKMKEEMTMGTFHILYGSNTGTSKEFALTTARKAIELNVKHHVSSLDEYYDKYLASGKEVKEQHTMLIISSTWNGHPPENAKKFKNWMMDCQKAGKRDAAKHMNFSVFGVGNSQWNITYLAFPKLVEDMLPTLGATKLSSYEPGDEDKDLQTKFEALQDILWYYFAIELGIMPTIDRKTLVKPAGSHLDFIVVEGPKEQKEEGGQYAITEVRELQSEGSGRSTVHVEIALPADVKYEAGDHLEITAWNHPHLVDQMCKSLGYDSNTWLKAVSKSNLPIPSWCPLGPVRLGQILSRELDINGVITRPVIQAITEALSDQHPYKAKLQRYGGKTQEALEAYEKEIVKNGINVVELLSQLPDVKIPLGVLLGVLPTLKKRSYSISSSPKRDSSKLTLSVGQVLFTTATGREHSGVASVYLGRLQVGSKIECHVVTSPMRYPADHMTPVICVCNGTGLAPFRGFLQEREHIQQQHGSIGQLHLFFGCRSRKEDFIYAEELLDYEARGLVKLHVAFSRDQEEKVYVQHMMRGQKELLADILMKQNGRFYVCGDARTMAKDVQEELRRMIVKSTGSTAEEAKNKLTFLAPFQTEMDEAIVDHYVPAEPYSTVLRNDEKPKMSIKEESDMSCPHLDQDFSRSNLCSSTENTNSKRHPVSHTALKRPPGPPYSLFVHNLPDLMPDFWVAARRLQKQYGPLVRLKFLGKKVYLLSDPELIAILLKERDKRLPKQELAAEGIFLRLKIKQADGDIWAFPRRILQSIFTGRAVSNFVPMFHRLGLEFLDEIEKEYNTNHVVKLIRLSERCMLEAICEVGLGISSGHTELKREFNETFEWLSDEGIKRQTRLGLFNKLPVARNVKFFKMLEVLDHILDEIMSHPLTDERHDLLALMARASDPETGRKLTSREVKDQILTILVAGHKTSALLQSWAIFEISQNPHVEKRIKRELKEVLHLDGTSLKRPGFQQLKDLKYMDLVLRETLRMHPPAQSAVRGLHETTVINDEWILDPCNIFISIYDTHRNSKYWPDPDRFDPDRFLPENVAKHHPAQYIPFGGYHRTCLGNVFALTEVKVNLCLLYQLYDARTSATHPIVEGNDVMFPPTDIPMKFIKRKKLLGHARKEGEPNAPLMSSPFISIDKEETEEKVYTNKRRTVSQTARLMGMKEEMKTGMFHILYGSNTGTSKEFAYSTARKASELNIQYSVSSLDEYYDKYLANGQEVKEHHTMLIITSTWNGHPPDNAKKFKNWMMDCQKAGKRDAAKHMNFSVFGVGNSQWNITYLAFPKLVEDMLPTLGATKLSSYEPGDEDIDLQTKFEALQDILWYFFAIELGLLPGVDHKTLVKPAGSHLDFIVVDHHEAQKGEEGQYAITEVRELQSEGSGRSTVHVEMALPADVKYEAGDHLEITAWNHPHLVDQMCKSLGYDSNTWLKAVSKSNLPIPSWCPLGPVRLGQILSRELDINGIVTRPVIQAITEALIDQHPYKAKLQRYGGKTQEALEAYEKEIVKNGINVVELLSQLPDVKIPLGVLLGVLPTLKKRSYSISSSPKRDSSKLTLSVGQVLFTTATGREHSGVASVYLGRLQVGSKIECHVVTSPMRYPADHMTPVICVCNGTGLAPFRGFLQEREHIQQQHGTIGQLHLFFGCRSRKEDFIYAEELLDFEVRGLAKLHVAFSRDQNNKIYVQHIMREQEEELRRIIAKSTGSTAEEAKNKFVEMVQEERVVLDVWG
ncbi:cytochrome P450, partial [Planoprotostelium fungivorum]